MNMPFYSPGNPFGGAYMRGVGAGGERIREIGPPKATQGRQFAPLSSGFSLTPGIGGERASQVGAKAVDWHSIIEKARPNKRGSSEEYGRRASDQPAAPSRRQPAGRDPVLGQRLNPPPMTPFNGAKDEEEDDPQGRLF